MKKSNIFRVSHSKVKLWLLCRMAYWYRYVEKLRRKRIARPLMFGRLVHNMVEADANADDPFVVLKQAAKTDAPLFRSEREEYGDILEDVRIIMTEYFDRDWGKDELVYVRMNRKGAEHTFEVEIADGLYVEGKIDAVAITPKKGKLRWLTEHKSFGRLPSPDHRWRDHQSNLYIRIIDMLGLTPVEGVVWDYIWSKPPTHIKLLKNGEASKKAVVTLPTRVREDLKKEGLRERDYPRLIKMAEQNVSQYFQRFFSPVKNKVVDHLFDQFVNTALEIRDLHGKRKDMSIGRHCEWCEFEPICRAMLTGGDADFIKAKDYRVNEKHTREEPDFEG